MKIKQTIISAIFGCCLTFSILFAGCSLFSDNASDLFEFNLKVGDTYYIKSIKSDDITELEIPESYNNKKYQVLKIMRLQIALLSRRLLSRKELQKLAPTHLIIAVR